MFISRARLYVLWRTLKFLVHWRFPQLKFSWIERSLTFLFRRSSTSLYRSLVVIKICDINYNFNNSSKPIIIFQSLCKKSNRKRKWERLAHEPNRKQPLQITVRSVVLLTLFLIRKNVCKKVFFSICLFHTAKGTNGMFYYGIYKRCIENLIQKVFEIML